MRRLWMHKRPYTRLPTYSVERVITLDKHVQDTKRLETKNIPSLLLEFSIPAMVGMLVNAIYNVVDGIFIGNSPSLGATGLAAASITYPITLVIVSFALMVGVGAATLFSISLGRKETQKAEYYLGHAVSLSALAGIFFIILGSLFIQPLLRTLGASPSVLPLAEDYLGVILYGGIFQIVAISLNKQASADGAPKVNMISMIIGAGFNIFFDYIFIVLLGWGMKGAAWATVIGQFLAMLWSGYYFISGNSTIKLRLSRMLPRWDYTLEILRVGTPAFLLQLANSFLTIIMNIQLVKYGGDTAVSVAAIVTSTSTIIIMLISGLTQGMLPLISYNTGARRPDRVKETIKWGAIAGTVIGVSGFLFVQFFPEVLIRLFNQEAAVIALGVPAIRIWTLAFPVNGFQMVWASYFQSVGEVRLASFLNLLRQVIFLVPFLFLFGPLFGLYGTLFAIPAAELFAFLVTGYAIRKEFYLKPQPWTHQPKASEE